MILYLQIHLALRPRFKIGITRRSLKGRSRNIAETTPGLQLPIFFCIVPFPAFWEGKMHRYFSYCHAPLRRGSGRTEWFSVGLLGVNLWTALLFYTTFWVVEGLGVLIIITKITQWN